MKTSGDLLPFGLGFALICLASATMGCHAADPGDIYFDAGARADILAPTPDGPADCPTTPTLAAPVVTNQPATTAQLRQPLRGQAPGATTLVASGAMGTAAPVKLASNGQFCIEVDLLPDAANTINLIPYDRNGCPGAATRLQVTHETNATKPQSGPVGVHDLSRNAPITSSHETTTGSLQSLVDGDTKSWAQLEMFDPELSRSCNKAIWLKVDLGKTYTVSKAVLRWGPLAMNDKFYATCFTVLLSSKASPVDPDPAHPDWNVAYTNSDAPAGEQTLTFSPESARWAAILLYENGTTDWMQYEKFALSEVEIHGLDPNVIPTAPADRCSQ